MLPACLSRLPSTYPDLVYCWHVQNCGGRLKGFPQSRGNLPLCLFLFRMQALTLVNLFKSCNLQSRGCLYCFVLLCTALYFSLSTVIATICCFMSCPFIPAPPAPWHLPLLGSSDLYISMIQIIALVMRYVGGCHTVAEIQGPSKSAAGLWLYVKETGPAHLTPPLSPDLSHRLA